MTRARKTRTAWGKIKHLPSGNYWAGEPMGGGDYRPAPSTFTSRAAAEKWLRVKELERDSSRALTAAAKANNTFGYWLDLWLQFKEHAWKDGHMSPKAYGNYEQNTRNWVRNVTVDDRLLVDMPIRKIGKEQAHAIQDCLATMVGPRGHLSPAQSLKAELNIYSVLKLAADEGAINKNPFREKGVYVNNTKLHRDQFDLTEEMVKAIADLVPAETRAAIFLWAYVGLRAGEAWGLQVRDVNLLHKRISISRTLTASPDHLIQDDAHHYSGGEAMAPALNIPFGTRIRTGVELRRPKTGRVKTLDLPAFVADELSKHLDRRQAVNSFDWLFVDHNGLPVNHMNWYSYIFKKVCRELELPDTIVVHTLRHFCGSHYLSLGYPPFLVQKMLDHSGEEMTRLYSHVVPGEASKWHALADEEYRSRMAKRS